MSTSRNTSAPISRQNSYQPTEPRTPDSYSFGGNFSSEEDETETESNDENSTETEEERVQQTNENDETNELVQGIIDLSINEQAEIEQQPETESEYETESDM